uniref:Uncharacterized protein n=1 Tax=Anguilla anguilla TaxID=7936 RepID=A0A0E9S2J2_ANGAN
MNHFQLSQYMALSIFFF